MLPGKALPIGERKSIDLLMKDDLFSIISAFKTAKNYNTC